MTKSAPFPQQVFCLCLREALMNSAPPAAQGSVAPINGGKTLIMQVKEKWFFVR